jgi:hypothetical protein
MKKVGKKKKKKLAIFRNLKYLKIKINKYIIIKVR